MSTKQTEWDLVIQPKASLADISFRDIWKYRDLLLLFVKRDLTAIYKQNLLGPIWFFLQPVFTTVVYYFMFGRIANISTDNKPALIFYLGGLVCWNYFSECINATSSVFLNNAALYSKVYFPRLIAPIATILSSSIKFFIQLSLFLILWCYYVFIQHNEFISISWHIALLPYLLVLVAAMGLSFGMLVSSLTTKYRDFRNLLGYMLQFGLYASPIIYPMSWLEEKLPLFHKICLLNPMSSVIETFKFGFFGTGTFSWPALLYSTVFTFVILFFSVILFNRTEKTFVDSV